MARPSTASHGLLNATCVLALLLNQLVLPFSIAYAKTTYPFLSTLPESGAPADTTAVAKALAEAEALRLAAHEERAAGRREELGSSQQLAVNSPQSAVNSPQSVVNSQQLTVNSQQSTVTPSATHALYLPMIGRPPQTALITPEGGGELALPDGKVRLTFPPGAAAAPVQVSAGRTAMADLPPFGVDRGAFISLEAREVDSGTAVAQFAQPVQVTAQYDPAILERAGADPRRLILRTRSGPGAPWYSLPSWVDSESHTVSAPLYHFSEIGLFATSPFSDVTPVQLAPFITMTAGAEPRPNTFFTNTQVITYTEGEIWLSSTVDGLGELLTNDEVVITVTRPNGSTREYSHDYYHPGSGAYVPTPPQEISRLFATGANTVTIALVDKRPIQYGSYGYYLTQPRNPYARMLGANYPTAVALSRLDIVSGNFLWREQDLAVSGLGPAAVFRRTYNSFDNHAGFFGLGWSSPFDSRLWQHFDGSVEVRRATGQRALFMPAGGGPGQSAAIWRGLGDEGIISMLSIPQSPNPRSPASAGYLPEPGVFDSLERSGDFFILTEKESLTRYHFSAADGALRRIEDSHGNDLAITYSPGAILVSDAAGRAYTLQVSDGRVAGLTDPAGRNVTYHYDGSGQLLLSVAGLRGQPVPYSYTTSTL
jgi:hypothetical protein